MSPKAWDILDELNARPYYQSWSRGKIIEGILLTVLIQNKEIQ